MCKDNSSQSASTTSTTTSSPSPNSPVSSVPGGGLPTDAFQFPHPHANNHHHHHLHRIHYISAPPHHHHPPHNKPPASSTPSPPSDKSGSPKSDSFESSSGPDDVTSLRRGGDNNELASLSRGKSDTALLDSSDGTEPPLLPPSCKEDSYVTFSKSKPGAPHEYSYPNLEPVVQRPPTKREVSTTKQRQQQQQLQQQQQASVIHNPPLPMKPSGRRKGRHKTSSFASSFTSSDARHSQSSSTATGGRLLLGQRARCRHCNEVFSRDHNDRGSCLEAPDAVHKLIECVACVWCAKCLIYHCMSDADGEYRHPCVCAHPADSAASLAGDDGDSSCRKWTALTVLSLFVPCLWCYWPLTACHRCGIACGCCGGRHVSV